MPKESTLFRKNWRLSEAMQLTCFEAYSAMLEFGRTWDGWQRVGADRLEPWTPRMMKRTSRIGCI
jgi:hypothetical protein